MLQTDGRRITHQICARPFLQGSAYTHNFACCDLNRDGLVWMTATLVVAAGDASDGYIKSDGSGIRCKTPRGTVKFQASVARLNNP